MGKAQQVLEAITRGDTFAKPFELQNNWVVSDFTGGIWFTIRDRPASNGDDGDDDAIGQVSVADGGIVFSTTKDALVTIAASITDGWSKGNKYWDLQGVITGPPKRVHTLASGRILVVADITRRTT